MTESNSCLKQYGFLRIDASCSNFMSVYLSSYIKLEWVRCIMRQQLANLMHDQRCGWMRYLFDVSLNNQDGSVTIQPEKVSQWKQQMITSYTELPDHEKIAIYLKQIKLLK